MMAEETEKPDQEIIQITLAPKDGGPWFPAERLENVEVKGKTVRAPIDYPGASIRDVFAIEILKGILANEEQLQKVSDLAELFNRDEGTDPNSLTWMKALSHESYEIADTMLRERGGGA